MKKFAVILFVILILSPVSASYSVTSVNVASFTSQIDRGLCNIAENPCDILAYMIPEMDRQSNVGLDSGGHFDTYVLDNNSFIYSKWPKSYEWFFWDANNIYLGLNKDEDPGTGLPRIYRHFDPDTGKYPPWFYRYMKLGDSVVSTHDLQELSTDCSSASYVREFSYTHTLLAHYDNYTVGSKTYSDVIQLRNIRGAGIEDYFFAKNYGVIQWDKYLFGTEYSAANPPPAPTETRRFIGSGEYDFRYPDILDCSLIDIKYDASIITGSFPSEVVSGQSFTGTITVKNTSNVTWQSDEVKLSTNGDANNVFSGSAPARISLPQDVKPGQTISIDIPMFAPPEQISFLLEWRMLKVEPTGTNYRFGTTFPSEITVVSP